MRERMLFQKRGLKFFVLGKCLFKRSLFLNDYSICQVFFVRHASLTVQFNQSEVLSVVLVGNWCLHTG